MTAVLRIAAGVVALALGLAGFAAAGVLVAVAQLPAAAVVVGCSAITVASGLRRVPRR